MRSEGGGGEKPEASLMLEVRKDLFLLRSNRIKESHLLFFLLLTPSSPNTYPHNSFPEHIPFATITILDYNYYH